MKEREISRIRKNNIRIRKLFQKRDIKNICIDEQISTLVEEKILLKI